MYSRFPHGCPISCGVRKTGQILFIVGFFIMSGCSSRIALAPGSAWPFGHGMSRLESDVRESCEGLTRNVQTGSVFLSWQDNVHPQAPLLSEEYLASMYGRCLIHNGFTLQDDGKQARYGLDLVMTPTGASTLVRATLREQGKVAATGEAYFVNGSDDWSRALGSYRFRTKTSIALGSKP